MVPEMKRNHGAEERIVNLTNVGDSQAAADVSDRLLQHVLPLVYRWRHSLVELAGRAGW